MFENEDETVDTGTTSVEGGEDGGSNETDTGTGADNGTGGTGSSDGTGGEDGGEADPYAGLDLDALLDANFDDDEIMGQTHKGLPEYSEILRHLPENGRKLISNLRAMTTRKTQELAESRRSLETQRAELDRERAALYSGDFAAKVKAAAAEPETPHDVFSDEGINAKIQQEAAKLMQEMIKPMQEELAQSTRQAEMTRFKADHPDLMEPEVKSAVVELLREREELRLEDAYYIATAKLGRAARNAQAEQARLDKQSKRGAWSKTSSGNNVGKTTAPKFKDAWSAYQWHRDNPGHK